MNQWIGDFWPTTFPDQRADPQKHRPKPQHQKNTGFRAQECFHPWNHTLPNCYASQLLDDGWLTWWCGWHDGVDANHDHRTYLGSFLAKLLWWYFSSLPLSGNPKQKRICLFPNDRAWKPYITNGWNCAKGKPPWPFLDWGFQVGGLV